MLGGAAVITVWWAAMLVFHDETRRRLPNQLTLPAAFGAVLGASLTEPILILGGLGWAGSYLLSALVGRGIGGGDVKLALSLGVLAAAAGGAGGVLAAAVMAGAMTVARGVAKQRVAERGEAVPHGPSMLVGTLVVLLFDTSQGALSHLIGHA